MLGNGVRTGTCWSTNRDGWSTYGATCSNQRLALPYLQCTSFPFLKHTAHSSACLKFTEYARISACGLHENSNVCSVRAGDDVWHVGTTTRGFPAIRLLRISKFSLDFARGTGEERLEAPCPRADGGIHLHGRLHRVPVSFEIGVTRLSMKIAPTVVMAEDDGVCDVVPLSRHRRCRL